jgi:hypothetical protein
LPIAQDARVEVGLSLKLVGEPTEIQRDLSQARHRVLSRHCLIVIHPTSSDATVTTLDDPGRRGLATL